MPWHAIAINCPSLPHTAQLRGSCGLASQRWGNFGAPPMDWRRSGCTASTLDGSPQNVHPVSIKAADDPRNAVMYAMLTTHHSSTSNSTFIIDISTYFHHFQHDEFLIICPEKSHKIYHPSTHQKQVTSSPPWSCPPRCPRRSSRSPW